MLDPKRWKVLAPWDPIAVSEMRTAGIDPVTGWLAVPLPRPDEIYGPGDCDPED